ncbi:hypothetical protein EW146_g3798 [Bondarzewia mesenterica]|uniref:EKC/KEOPS complex subunit CGI121 n=1 Tax=Bondarzewia mesenterica TaxID=1095465 RepID=A0A4S4LXR5_9AGAM|nr:hypothetical protein EW146_g3798 [Bondarzewia mesenterica]
MMETYTYPHFPANASVVHVALFTSVTNGKDLRARIVKASTLDGPTGDAERVAVNFAFIDARLVSEVPSSANSVPDRLVSGPRSQITSRLHLQTAIYQAILAEVQSSLRTKTVHSEMLWALNPSNNITEAIRRYGVSDTSTALLVVRVASPDLQDVEGKMRAIVEGNIRPLSELDTLTDWPVIKKYHKLNTELAIKNAGEDVVSERKIIDNIAHM